MALEIFGTTVYMARGETSPVRFEVTEGEIYAEDRGVFTIAKKSGEPVLRKIIEPDTQENAFLMMLVFEDTADLRAGAYDWSFRVVRNARFDEAGRIEEAQMNNTVIAEGELRLERVAGGAR